MTRRLPLLARESETVSGTGPLLARESESVSGTRPLLAREPETASGTGPLLARESETVSGTESLLARDTECSAPAALVNIIMMTLRETLRALNKTTRLVVSVLTQFATFCLKSVPTRSLSSLVGYG